MPGSLGKDKMSKGARNVDIGHFDITQPPERVKNGSHRPEWQMKALKKNRQYVFQMKIKSKQSFQSWLGQTV